jgi:hypothetical protein
MTDPKQPEEWAKGGTERVEPTELAAALARGGFYGDAIKLLERSRPKCTDPLLLADLDELLEKCRKSLAGG